MPHARAVRVADRQDCPEPRAPADPPAACHSPHRHRPATRPRRSARSVPPLAALPQPSHPRISADLARRLWSAIVTQRD